MRRNRHALVAGVALSLVVAACTGNDGSLLDSNAAGSTSTSAPSVSDGDVPEAVSTIYEFMRLFNAGDRRALEALWSEDALMLGVGTLDEPHVQWMVDVAMDGLHEHISSECHLTEPETVYCDELHIDDLIRPAGIAWRASRVYEVVSGRIVSFTEVASNRETSNVFTNRFMDWLATEDPDLYERAFDLDAEPVWRSIEAIHEVVALAERFVADSPDYPLVLPERLENPELTGTVAGRSDLVIEVFNGETHQIELVEWGVQRYRLAGLVVPPVASVTFPPHELCAKNSGWAIDDGVEQRIVLCIFENEMCEDEGFETLSTLARATLIHELAHVWTNENLDSAARETFLELRGLDAWRGPGLAWAEQGTEHAAEMIMWGLMEEALELFRLGNPPCAELEKGYQSLTGSTPPRGGC